MSNRERRDFFIGDGTGMGMSIGREIAGIMGARNLRRRRWQGACSRRSRTKA
jgi:hypothetical protein